MVITHLSYTLEYSGKFQVIFSKEIAKWGNQGQTAQKISHLNLVGRLHFRHQLLVALTAVSQCLQSLTILFIQRSVFKILSNLKRMSDRNINFHLHETWENIYKSTVCQKREWIDNPSPIFSSLKQFLPDDKSIAILQLGCGTSILNEVLWKEGYQNITSVDFSKQVIKARGEKNKNIKFVRADFVQPFKFAAQVKYDIIIDKGSIDCLFCQEDYVRKVLKCLLQCYNNLSCSGKLIMISLAPPKNRKFMLRNKIIPFSVQVKKCRNTYREQARVNIANYYKDKNQNCEEYYIYVCTKDEEGVKQEGNLSGIDLNEVGQDIPSQHNQTQKQNNSQTQIKKMQEQSNDQNYQNENEEKQNFEAEQEEGDQYEKQSGDFQS